jgi:threonine dehydrogenase-like Zn-dependent dehydrogenase
MARVRAVRFDGARASLAHVAEPTLRDGWAVAEVLLAGICSTDLQILRGYMRFEGVLGHECVLRVVDGPSSWVGKRAVAEINFACGACPSCDVGLGRHCPARTVMGIAGADGAMAERIAVPLSVLHLVPDALPDELAVFTEPLAAAFEVLEQVKPPPGARALVLGDGKLGTLQALVLLQAGLDVTVVGRHAHKLSLVEARGARVGTELRPSERFDLVVEATGSAEGLSMAIAVTRPRGVVVLKSTVADPHALHLAPVVIHELQLVGSRCGPFAPALAALAGNDLDPRPLVEAVLPLDEAMRGLALAGERGARKVLLRPQR